MGHSWFSGLAFAHWGGSSLRWRRVRVFLAKYVNLYPIHLISADTNSHMAPILPWLRSIDALNTHDASYDLAIAGGSPLPDFARLARIISVG